MYDTFKHRALQGLFSPLFQLSSKPRANS